MTNMNTNFSAFGKAVTPAAKDAAKVDTTQTEDTVASSSTTAGLVGKDLSQELAMLAQGPQADIQQQRVKMYLKTMPSNDQIQSVHTLAGDVLQTEFPNLSPRAMQQIANMATALSFN